MVFHADRNGNQMRTTYNVDGNPVLECACDRNGENEVIRSWDYDDIGNVKKAVAGGFCYTYEYRPDGKLVRKSSSGRTIVSCTYYADKNLESLTDVSGRRVFYSYDSLGRLERIRDEEGTEIARYSHTPGGKLKDIRHGNGMHTVYEYDTDGNVIGLTLKNREGRIFSDFRYEYDLNGNRTLKSGSCLLPGEDSLKEQVIRYRYDGMNRLVEERYTGTPIRYVYDQCGNRLEKVDNAGKEVYTYNCKNQLTGRENNSETINYRYDLQGNVLEEASPLGKTEYRYNAFNQQVAVFMKDGGVQENQYDAEYLRAEVSENGRRSRLLYYNGELLAESEPNETVTGRYILGYGVAAGWQKGKEGYHSYHLDEQSSTVYITDAGQGLENSYQYDAFGAIRGRQEGIHSRILYTGQQYDQVTGQYYLRARYYNPVVGRFLQEDVYCGDGLNLYAYCHNNSVIYYDPSGYAVRDPNAKSLGDGQYQYPDGSIRNENGHFAGTTGANPGEVAVGMARDYFETGDNQGKYTYGGREVSVDTPLGERRYDLGYTTEDNVNIGIEVKGDTASRDKTQRAKDSLLTENGGYETTPRVTHNMDRVDEVWIAHVNTETGEVVILEGEVSKYDTEGKKKKDECK